MQQIGRHHPQFVSQALAWAAEGKLRHRDHIYEGIENAPQAFVAMLAGEHKRKVMVRVASDDRSFV